MELPVSRHVLIYDAKRGEHHRIHISEFCSTCGHRRGQPQIVTTVNADGQQFITHEWENQCGHPDTPESLLAEVDYQCAQQGCTILTSERFYPYCGTHCAAAAADDISTNLLGVAAGLGKFLGILVGLMSVVEELPDNAARSVVAQSVANVEEAQRRLAAAAQTQLANRIHNGAHG